LSTLEIPSAPNSGIRKNSVPNSSLAAAKNPKAMTAEPPFIVPLFPKTLQLGQLLSGKPKKLAKEFAKTELAADSSASLLAMAMPRCASFAQKNYHPKIEK
jgi:hypothetical protein